MTDAVAQYKSILEEVEGLRKKNALLEEKTEALQKQVDDLQADLADTANELQLSINQFKVMANSLPVIVWTAEANGNVDYFNQRWYDFTGQDEEIPLGWGWQPVVHPDDLERTLEAWNRSILTGLPYEVEYRFKRHSDSSYQWYLGNAIPLTDKEGKVLKWFGTCTDIQEQKAAQSKKDEFISIASHELKTPLTTVKAFMQIAQTIIQKDHGAFSFINKAAMQLERLEKLIADLLDVSKINAGKMMYDIEEFNFTDALKETIDSVQQTAPQHRIELKAADGITIKGDRLRLEQVMNNLLTNAIKYSPAADRIIVSSELQDDKIVVSVQDFGIGIAPQNLTSLFERYYRADNTAMRFQGLGLGLYISSEIIKRHNGSFWIESELGKGSTFYFLLPVSGKSQFTDYETDHTSYFRSSYLTLQYNASQHWIEADWIGYQNYNTVTKGCMIMLNLMKNNKCSKVLNDNTHVTGNWSEAADWVSEYWFPAMKEGGLKHFAWIYSPSTFSRMSANKTVDSIDSAFNHFFDNKQEAIAWLSDIE